MLYSVICAPCDLNGIDAEEGFIDYFDLYLLWETKYAQFNRHLLLNLRPE
jgi:hypothetical protein